jgi:hypothetical protein
MILNKNVIEKYNQNKRRLIWEAWKDYMEGVKKLRRAAGRMGDILRRYHLRPAL